MVQLRNCQRPSVLQLHGELLSSPHSSDPRCQPAIQNIADEIDTRRTAAIVSPDPLGPRGLITRATVQVAVSAKTLFRCRT